MFFRLFAGSLLLLKGVPHASGFRLRFLKAGSQMLNLDQMLLLRVVLETLVQLDAPLEVLHLLLQGGLGCEQRSGLFCGCLSAVHLALRHLASPHALEHDSRAALDAQVLVAEVPPHVLLEDDGTVLVAQLGDPRPIEHTAGAALDDKRRRPCLEVTPPGDPAADVCLHSQRTLREPQRVCKFPCQTATHQALDLAYGLLLPPVPRLRQKPAHVLLQHDRRVVEASGPQVLQGGHLACAQKHLAEANLPPV
mmetsp:Transcript_16713/g.28214  ORF Transcript_16713/g.28214 Transcript_16713/m.28214 type:complete len:251 (+) Transcript_16713:1930-2682(+)